MRRVASNIPEVESDQPKGTGRQPHSTDRIRINTYGPKTEQVQIHPNLPNLQEELEKNPKLQVILE